MINDFRPPKEKMERIPVRWPPLAASQDSQSRFADALVAAET